MSTIPLRDVTGQIVDSALVDDEDFDRLSRHRWSLMHGKARRGVKAGGRLRTVLMHREIMGAVFGDGLAVEHLNGDKLDNRRANLRVRPGDPAPTPGRSSTPHARAGSWP